MPKFKKQGITIFNWQMYLSLSIFFASNLLLATSAKAAENSLLLKKLIQAHPDIVMLIRIPDLRQANSEINQLLQKIAPNWIRPGAFFRTIGGYLRNPEIANIEKKTFLELVFYNSKKTGKSAVVAVFPVDEPSTYVRQMESQATISSQAIGGGITLFREQHSTTTNYYLTSIHGKLIIFGKNQDLVKKTYNLYQQHEKGILPHALGVLEAHIQFKRFLNNHTSTIDQGLARLKNNIAADLISGNSPEMKSALTRLTNAALQELKRLSNQLIQGQFNFFLRDDSIESTSKIELATGVFTEHVLNTPLRKPELISYLPAATISFDWSSISVASLSGMISKTATILGTAIEGTIDADTQEDLQTLHKLLLKTEPVEIVKATVTGYQNQEKQKTTSNRVAIIKLRRPKGFPLVIKQLLKIAGGKGGLVEALALSGIDLLLKQQKATTNLAGIQINSLSIKLSKRRELTQEKIPQLAVSLNYFFAIKENFLVIATGAQAKKILENILAPGSGTESFRAQPFGKNIFRNIGKKRLLHLSAFSPLLYIQSATYANIQVLSLAPTSGKPHPAQKAAKEFANQPSNFIPIQFYLSHSNTLSDNIIKNPTLSADLRIPHIALREIIKAVLEPGESDKEQVDL